MQIPPPLEELMKKKYTVTINQSAMDKAVTSSAALKAKDDSTRAKNAERARWQKPGSSWRKKTAAWTTGERARF